MKLYCDNKSTINIAHNPVQHDHTKYVKVDIHFIKEKLNSELILLIRVGYTKERRRKVDYPLEDWKLI